MNTKIQERIQQEGLVSSKEVRQAKEANQVSNAVKAEEKSQFYRGHCGPIQGHTALTGGCFGLAHLDLPAGDVLCSLTPAHLFDVLVDFQVPALQVDVAVEEAQQLPGAQASVQHEDVGCWLLVFGLAV